MSLDPLVVVPLLFLFLALVGALFAYRRSTLTAYISAFVFFRFHLFAAGVLFFFPSIATRSSLLQGLMVIDSARGIACVTAFAFITSWAILGAVVVTFVYGPRQFGTVFLNPPSWVKTLRTPLASLVTLPILYTVIDQSHAQRWVRALSTVMGFLLACVVLRSALWIFHRLLPTRLQAFDLFHGTKGWDLPPEAPTDGPEHPLARILGPGVVNRRGQIWPGHVAIVSFLAVVAILYWAGYWMLAPAGLFFDVIPALAFVEFLLIPVVLGLAGAAFVLDRPRIPVGLAVIGVSFLIYALGDTDHHFVISPEKTAAATAPQVGDLEPVVPEGDVVVVSAAGGGIQAAAWTARVLAGLQEDLGPEFARQIRFISAVSGGAVGAMFFVDAYTPNGPPSASDLDMAVYAACTSSLGAVAWGLAYPDLLRVLWPLPIAREVDRGWALEQSWARFLLNPKATLGEWRQSAAMGWRPATAFNTTVAETGQRLILTTAAFSMSGASSFWDRYKAADVPVLRAVRLAATFPYVSPMARALWSEFVTSASELPGDHLGDGGYYDSLGVVTLVDWMLQLKDLGAKGPRRILVVRIEPFPAADLTKSPRGGVASAADRRGRPSQGWLYEAIGPLVAMMNVRSASQVARGDLELRLIREVIERRGLSVKEAVFVPEHVGPLSWHLTRKERRHIDEDWEAARRTAAMQTVLDWARRPKPTNRSVPHCSRR